MLVLPALGATLSVLRVIHDLAITLSREIRLVSMILPSGPPGGDIRKCLFIRHKALVPAAQASG